MLSLIYKSYPFHLIPHQIQGLKVNCKPSFPIIDYFYLIIYNGLCWLLFRNLLINNVSSNAILLEYGFNFGAHIDVERDGHLMNKIGGGSIIT